MRIEIARIDPRESTGISERCLRMQPVVRVPCVPKRDQWISEFARFAWFVRNRFPFGKWRKEVRLRRDRLRLSMSSPDPDEARPKGRAKSGGESGIRTHGRVSPTHAFQACSLNHSDISPL